MRRCGGIAFLTLIVVVLLFTSVGQVRDLTFEDRVKAQEATERVYYSRQIGATRLFEEAVPREVLEDRAHKYLQQAVAHILSVFQIVSTKSGDPNCTLFVSITSRGVCS